MDGVVTLGRQAGEATMLRADGSGSEMEMGDFRRRRIMQQWEITERNKDEPGVFSSEE
jgi:hypothetical protein